MSAATLTKTRMIAGVWEGILTAESAEPPQLNVTHLDTQIDGVTVTKIDSGAGWIVHVPIPVATLADGLQTYIIRDAKSDETLNSFALLAGDALSEDIRAEMDLLRDELDMLKSAFRRHCVETM